jgi:mRNA interferase MazF
MSAAQPARGDVWFANLDPIVGREQSGIRPVLVLSVDKFNAGPADLLIVLPITSKWKGQPLHVAISPPEAGLQTPSFVKPEDIRSISKQRLRQYCGAVSIQTIQSVEMRIRILIGL